MSNSIYLDYAAATPVDIRVFEAMRPYMSEKFANPSSLHGPGREMRKVLESARSRLAIQLGAKSTEIILTAGSTEAAYLAINGSIVPDSRIAVAASEHEAVISAAEQIAGESQVDVIPVGTDGLVGVETLSNFITDETSLVCIHYVNNEIGVIQPISKLAAEIQQIRSSRLERGIEVPLYLYCDAAQAGLMSLQVNRLGVDLMSMGGSKLYGPHGSGFLYVKTGTTMRALIAGGGQEGGLRGGTENVAAAVGLATALELIQADRQAETRRLMTMRDRLWRSLKDLSHDLGINGSLNHRHPGSLNFIVPGCDGESLIAHLDAAGFAVATGSACTAASQEPSRVLRALGRSTEQAEQSLRVTFGRHTTSDELDEFVKTLDVVIKNIRAMKQN